MLPPTWRRHICGDDSPTWIGQALSKRRQVAARVRYFMAAPLVVARSDLLLTGPSMLIRSFAELVPKAASSRR